VANHSGPAPWNHQQFWDWREGYKRVTKADLKRMGVQHSPESGYRNVTWDKEPRNTSFKKVKLYNGRTVSVPDGDFEDFIGHRRSPAAEDYNEIAQYIDKAWAGPKQEVAGVGHIYNITYSPTYQLLWVEFDTDGAVVVYFRVPKEVYSELYYLATSGAKAISTVDGEERHVLGMRFWDIIRIRGQLENSRYRFEYQIEGERKGTAFSREMEAGVQELRAAPQAAAMDTHSEIARTYDRYAANMLTGSQRDAYNKLTTTREKEHFLHKAGIL
jgi:hypothetical protein